MDLALVGLWKRLRCPQWSNLVIMMVRMILKGSFTKKYFWANLIFSIVMRCGIDGIEPEESLNSNFVCFKYVPKNLDSRLKGPCDLGAAS